MKRMGPIRPIGLVLTIALMAAGCNAADGGGSATGTGPTTRPEPSPSPTPALRTVSADEIANADLVLYTGGAPQGFDNGGYGFGEEEVSSPGPTITVGAGEELTLVLFNVSDEFFLEHDFTIVRKKEESAPPLWGAQTEAIKPGESTLMSFTPQAPGTYFYICSLPGHMSGHGMWGRLVVEQE